MALWKTTFTALSILGLTMGASVANAAPPGFLKFLSRTPSSEPHEAARQLTEVDGPWMILAATFAGEEGKLQAHALADELAKSYQIQAFIHEENFDFGGRLNVTSPTGRPVRYQNQTKYNAYAVLVGEYDTVDHPDLVRDLKRLKACKPQSLDGPTGEKTTDDNPLVQVRKLQKNILKRTGKPEEGPLGNAFATTNPMLPEEFFDAPEVDAFVMELNDKVAFNLLDNRGRYTVIVRTFSGLGTIVDGRKEKQFKPSTERMANCAEDADAMVRKLREEGVDAYQFHDRTRSLVTIGSFETLGRQLPGGGFEYDPAIRSVMQKYCAGSESKPTQFGPGIAARHVNSIPFDVQPTPIAVPKKSKRSLYMSKLGMR